MSATAVSRVLSVELRNFRGFKTPDQSPDHFVETDADLVLLSGANGQGKTSFLEALLLLLTGWYDISADPERKPESYAVRALISHNETGRDTPAAPADRFNLHAKVQLEDDSGTTPAGRLDSTWSKESSGYVPMPEDLPQSRLLGEAPDNSMSARELDARLTGFFQGRIDRLFDQAASGRTFRDVFDPLPAPVAFFAQKTLWDEWEETIQEAKSESLFQDRLAPPANIRRQRLADQWMDFRRLLEELVSLLGWDEKVPAKITDEVPLDEWASRLAGVNSADQTLRDDFQRHIEQTLSRAIQRAEQDADQHDAGAVARIKRQRDECQQKKQALESQYPHLDRELSGFDSTEGLPDALQLFRALEQFADTWGRVELENEELTRVREEFRKVSGVDAGKCARMLEDFLLPRREAKHELDDLDAQIERLDRSIRGARSSQRLADLRDIQTRLQRPLSLFLDSWGMCHQARLHELQTEARARASRILEELDTALKGCQGIIEAVAAPDESILKYLVDRVHAVMSRFSMVPGCLPIRLEVSDDDTGEHRSTHITMADGRRLEHLSSGQKAQAALALMVAQNQGAADFMAHRVLLLDDITTDYDLSNLSRQALLLRQLAYGASDPLDRRQVFLSSHHEDMTNQLLDMLAPPDSKSMKLVRFRGWSPDSGPEYDLLEVEPSAPVNKEALRSELESF